MNTSYELYRIDETFAELCETFVNPETGEITIPDALFALLEERKAEVIESAVHYIKNQFSLADSIGEEITRLQERKRTAEKVAESLKFKLSQIDLNQAKAAELLASIENIRAETQIREGEAKTAMVNQQRRQYAAQRLANL
jgi:hypothetical protein